MKTEHLNQLTKVCSELVLELIDLKTTKRLERKLGELMALMSVLAEEKVLDVNAIEKSGNDKLKKLRNIDESKNI